MPNQNHRDRSLLLTPFVSPEPLSIALTFRMSDTERKSPAPSAVHLVQFDILDVDRLAGRLSAAGLGEVEIMGNVKPTSWPGVDLSWSVRWHDAPANATFNQCLELRLPPDPSLAFYLPGLWIDGNPYTAKGAPSQQEGASWSFREDRLAWPAAIAFSRQKRLAYALLRLAPAAHETDLPFRRGYRYTGAYHFASMACDIGALGFRNESGQQSLTANLPFAELPRSYQDKRCLVPPVVGFWRIQPEVNYRAAYRLMVVPANDPYEAFEAVGRQALELRPGNFTFAGDRSIAGLKRSLARHVAGHFFPARGRRGVAGIYTFVQTFGAKPILPICEPAFTGKAFWLAKNLMDIGEPELAARGEAVFDSWLARGVRRGLPVDFWLRGPALLPLDFPFTFAPPRVYPHNPFISTRRLAEAAQALLEAPRRLPHADAWRKAGLEFVDRLAGLQQADGGFPRRCRIRDGAPLELDNVGAAPYAVNTLLVAYGVSGDRRYQQAAERGGEFLRQRMIEPVRFHGSTLDADCEDKEAATACLEAMRRLHEATGDERWLVEARRCAWMSLFWVQLSDIPFAADSLFGKWALRTRGLTHVSTENNHLDVYLFRTPADLRWLATRLGEDLYRILAWETLLSSLQVAATAAHRLGPHRTRGVEFTIPEGLVPEVLQHTWWVYLNKPLVRKHRRLIKGFADHKTSMWTGASLWYALDEMRRVVDDDEWRGYFEP